jgi:hypothetical protein
MSSCPKADFVFMGDRNGEKQFRTKNNRKEPVPIRQTDRLQDNL